MLSFFSFLSVERFRFLSTRILLCGLMLGAYLFLWRPTRILITEQLVYPQVQYFDDRDEMFESTMKTGALLVFYEYGDNTKQLQYRPQFGFFFLVAIAALFFITTNKKPYLLLAAVHLAGSVLAYLCLMVGASGFSPGFILTDAIAGYLVPAVSLALVPLVSKNIID